MDIAENLFGGDDKYIALPEIQNLIPFFYKDALNSAHEGGLC